MLKSSSTLVQSVPINLSIKFRFISVNGHRETNFVDTLRIYLGIYDLVRGPFSLVRTIGYSFDVRSSEIRLRKLKLTMWDKIC